MKTSIFTAAMAGASAVLAALPPVTVRGNAFFTGDERFYVRGVAYQPGGASDAADPLLDMPGLRRDVERFKQLGINTIRIYSIDNSQSHEEAMKLLDDAGIYLALDANTPKYSLNRLNAAAVHASYNEVYLQSVFATIDAFKDYSNLLLFFSGNEVIDAPNNTNTAPYVKAVTRDMKNYISQHADRPIPVGYSSADVNVNIREQASYFNCGNDEMARADFFAFNDYSWCSPSSFERSGWDQKVQNYTGYSIPVFLSEFGCITNRRDWDEIEALYSTDMTGVYSGGLVYEYTVEPNGYGLVEVDESGEIVPNADFERLARAYRATPNPSGDGGYSADNDISQCPSASAVWEVRNPARLPAMPLGAQRYMDGGAGRGPGLDLEGEGSQWAGTPSQTQVEASTSGGSSSSNGRNGSSGSSQGDDGENAAPSVRVGAVTVVAAALLCSALML